MKSDLKRAGKSVNALGYLLVVGSLLVPFLYITESAEEALRRPAFPWGGVLATMVMGLVMVYVGRRLKTGPTGRSLLPGVNTALILGVIYLLISALSLDPFGGLIGAILTWELVTARRRLFAS